MITDRGAAATSAAGDVFSVVRPEAGAELEKEMRQALGGILEEDGRETVRSRCPNYFSAGGQPCCIPAVRPNPPTRPPFCEMASRTAVRQSSSDCSIWSELKRRMDHPAAASP